MTSYDYLEVMKEDILTYIRDEYTPEQIAEHLEDRAAWEEELNEQLWIEDSVTGNASGSYTFNTWRAREYVLDNIDLLHEAVSDFDTAAEQIGEMFINEQWETMDVIIRCYSLSQAIASALDELEEVPACITCNPSAPCFKECYARRLEQRYTRTRDAYRNNLNILTEDPAAYWLQVKAAAMVTRFFRFHVSGDIPDSAYMCQMVQLAKDLPGTTFLAFTKQYQIVNEFVKNVEPIPQNLKIIFSNWGAWKCENPHGLPVCEIVFKGETPAPDWKICGGNCTACACRGVGCWELKHGETIAIYKH